jgi:hypothetical protein
MIPIISLVLILAISILVTRVAAVMLEHTGLSRDSARFQARSAFTGVGYTTSEAEGVVSHPVRRAIVMWLMLFGNVGIISAMAALLLSAFDLRTSQGVGILLVILVGGLGVVCLLGSSRWVDGKMRRVIQWALKRWTGLDARDYSRLLHIHDRYGISRMQVEAGSWIDGMTLDVAGLLQEGLLVLGIECSAGDYVGVPPSDFRLQANDALMIYGCASQIMDLRGRASGSEGDRAHQVAAHKQLERASYELGRAGR